MVVSNPFNFLPIWACTVKYVFQYRQEGNFANVQRARQKTRALHGTLFLFGTDVYGFQQPRVQMVRDYGFHIIAVGTWTVPEKLCLLWSGLRSLVKSAVWLRSGLRFQVKSAGRFRSGFHLTSFFPNCDISHAFNFRHAFTATYQLFYIRLPSSRLLCRLHILEALAASFLLRSNDGVVLLNLR